VACGCTTRRLEITSSPEGADVYLDSIHRGRTPLTLGFRYGGVHEIALFKRGYETTVVRYDSSRTAFDQPPFDLFTDLGPAQARDHQHVHIEMRPSSLDEAWSTAGPSILRAVEERAATLREKARAFLLDIPAAPLLPEAEGAGEKERGPSGEGDPEGSP